MNPSAGPVADRPRRAGHSPAVVDGWAAMGPRDVLRPMRWEAPPPDDREVRVRVSHCGLCFTDLHAIDDLYGITTYPFVPGHEIVGTVEARGLGVTTLEVGDRVGIGWQGRSCRTCEWCERGEEQLCQDIASSGTFQRHGGFGASVTVDAAFAYPLPSLLPADVAAVLMCAGLAVYAPLRRFAPEAGGRVAVYGVGGLGHLAIGFAHALGFEVTAFSGSPAKEEDALAVGADRFAALGDRGRLRPFDYAFDLVLCTAHGDLDWWELLALLAKRGRLVLVGFPNIVMNPTDLVAHELTITGSLLGNRATMREMLDFATAHAIAPRIEQQPMAQVNDAVRRLRENRVRYRVVLTR